MKKIQDRRAVRATVASALSGATVGTLVLTIITGGLGLLLTGGDAYSGAGKLLEDEIVRRDLRQREARAARIVMRIAIAKRKHETAARMAAQRKEAA